MSAKPEFSNSSSILQPGQRIRPNISPEQATELIEFYYNLKVISIHELNSYDDNNFLIKGISDQGCQGKYTFKVLNSLDSKRSGHIEAEHVAMEILSREGINCPIAIKNKFGNAFALISVQNVTSEGARNESSHVIRILTYVDGNIMYDVPPSKKLFEDVGQYIANVQSLLKGVSHPAVDNYVSLWKLSCVPELGKFLYVVQDFPERFNLVKEIIQTYEEKVRPVYRTLERGVLHGDVNEQNIIVASANGQAGEYAVHGLIDFADLQVDPYVSELAITMCYMMLQCVQEGSTVDPFVGAQHVLRGYTSVKKIKSDELKVLRVLICCRLCISLVMSAYTYSLNPGNDYLLITSKTGWGLLARIWREKTDEEMFSEWKDASQ